MSKSPSETTDAGVCAICDEPIERDEVFMSTLDGHWFCSLPCRNTFWELRALRRCAECFDDGQDTDVRRPMLDRLVALGWLNQTGRGRWEIGFEGARLLRGAENHG